MRLSNLRIDVDKAENGAWFEYHSGVKFKIARLGSTEYQLKHASELAKAFEEHGTKLSQEQYVDVAAKALAVLVTDWEGILDDDDDELKYSKKKCLEIMCSPEYSDIRDFVTIKSNMRENFKLIVDKSNKKK